MLKINVGAEDKSLGTRFHNPFVYVLYYSESFPVETIRYPHVRFADLSFDELLNTFIESIFFLLESGPLSRL